MIIDIIFTLGTIGFLFSEAKQFLKLYKHEGNTKAISRTHLKLKIFALLCVATGYYLSCLWMSMGVSLVQLALTLGITYFVYKKYQRNTLVSNTDVWIEKDEKEYKEEIEQW